MELNELLLMAEFLFKNKITCHVDTLNGDFYNGLIIELHEGKMIVVQDRVLGKTPILFSDIKILEKFRGR